MEQNSNVSLTISKDIVAPIVEAKIKEAILAALGGSEQLVAQAVKEILYKKVNEKGEVTGYSYDKFNWLDVVVTRQIKAAVEKELQNQISESTEAIKKALIKQLKSDKGASQVATALLDGLNGTFKNSWSSAINITITPTKP